MDAATDSNSVMEANEESVVEVTLLKRIPHFLAKSRKSVASIGSNGCLQFEQVVIIVAPRGMNGVQEHIRGELYTRDWKYAVRLMEH